MKKVLLLLTVPILLTSCSNSSSSPSATAASTSTISGSLVDNSTSGFDQTTEEIVFGNSAISVEGNKVICITSEPPISTYTGTVDSTGAFSVNVPKGLSVGCSVTDTSDTQVATFVISKTSGKNMRGESQTIDRFGLDSDANLGSLSYDETGKITIPETTLGSSLKTETLTTPFDPTGTWTVASVDFTMPTGYSAVCASGSNNCHGPTEGESLFLKRINGYEWDGQARTSNQKYGIMVWSSQTAYTACGSKLGVSYADAKSFGKIDLTDSGVNEGQYTWSSTVTSQGTTYNLTNGWKIATATSSWAVNDCKMVSVGGLPGWKCTDGDGDYQVGLGGGCYKTGTASKTPINVSNWSGMSCSNETLSGTFAGYTKGTCTATNYDHDNNAGTPAENVTCVFTNGCFRSDGTSALCDGQAGTGHFNYATVGSIVAQGALCSSIGTSTPTHALAGLQCYSNAYWNSSIRDVQTACLPDIRTDYSALTANDFIVSQNGPQKAKNEYVFEHLEYKNDNTASFLMDEQDTRGVQVKDSSGQQIWINCKTSNKFSMTLVKKSATKILADFTSETRLIDTKKACKANESSAGVGTVKSMFYLNASSFNFNEQKPMTKSSLGL